MKQKELYRTRKFSIGVADALNYYVAQIGVAGEDAKNAGDEVLTNTKFFSRLDGALAHVARQVAMRESETLDELIDQYRQVGEELVDACKGV